MPTLTLSLALALAAAALPAAPLPLCAHSTPVAPLRSPHTLWCLPTAVVAALGPRAPADLTPRALARSVTMHKDGTTVAEIGQALDDLGIPWLALHATPSALATLLDTAAAPVVAVVPSGGTHHAVVVDGAGCCPDQSPACTRLRAMDPATGAHTVLAESELHNAPLLVVAPPSARQRAALAQFIRRNPTLARQLGAGRHW
ncbi:MAG: hypothetical protein FJ100_19935 [Deltaproteobacteria bacterium]|nr:hypothetical protein [Deltaproteobacteria bacterium]